jgi:hypothetical protein
MTNNRQAKNATLDPNTATNTMKLFPRISLAIFLGLTAIQPTYASGEVIFALPPEEAAPEVKPGTFYIKPNCQITKQQNQDYYKLDKRFPLNIGDVPHQLYTGYFIDGSPIVCRARLDLTEAERLEKLPIMFLDSVSVDANNPNAFIFRSAEGNGLEVPIRHWGAVFKTNQPEIIDLNIFVRQGKLTPSQKAQHRFKGKAGQSIAITLDSRAQARFTLVNRKGIRLSSGVVSQVSPAISRATLTLPADDTYEVIITPSKAKQQSYTLSVNLDRIPTK